jgi:molecular chaperone DnaK
MNKISAYIEDFRKKIELIIKEKNIKEAKLLNREIDQLDFELRNAVTGNAMDAQFLKHFNDNFNSFHWKNSSKARQLINQGMQMVNSGNTSSIRPILVELVGLLPQDEIPETLE